VTTHASGSKSTSGGTTGSTPKVRTHTSGGGHGDDGGNDD
jgi:hypothetical protein